jgi:hypothetical protein
MSVQLAVKKIDPKLFDKEDCFDASNELRPLIPKPVFQVVNRDDKCDEEMIEDS